MQVNQSVTGGLSVLALNLQHFWSGHVLGSFGQPLKRRRALVLLFCWWCDEFKPGPQCTGTGTQKLLMCPFSSCCCWSGCSSWSPQLASVLCGQKGDGCYAGTLMMVLVTELCRATQLCVNRKHVVNTCACCSTHTLKTRPGRPLGPLGPQWRMSSPDSDVKQKCVGKTGIEIRTPSQCCL